MRRERLVSVQTNICEANVMSEPKPSIIPQATRGIRDMFRKDGV